MKTVKAKLESSYIIKYDVYESECPNCSAVEEHHIEREESFFNKEMKCWKCEFVFRVESE